MNTTTRTFKLTGTQAKKIASGGFGMNLMCIGYMNSRTLSPLNEKFFAMLFNEVVFNSIRRIELKTDNGNGFNFEVEKFCRNKVSTTINLKVTAINTIYNHFANDYTAISHIYITYKNGGAEGKTSPRKFAGKIKECYYCGIPYQLADFVVLPNGKKDVIEWYYTSYTRKIR